MKNHKKANLKVFKLTRVKSRHRYLTGKEYYIIALNEIHLVKIIFDKPGQINTYFPKPYQIYGRRKNLGYMYFNFKKFKYPVYLKNKNIGVLPSF